MSEETRPVSPETASVGGIHDASSHLGSVKTPLYETTTFVFPSAEEAKRAFEIAYGLDHPEPGEQPGYIYSRLDSPNLRVVEERLARWEETDDALLFNSGMAAITTAFLTLLRPGDLVLYSNPLYGGTATLLKGLLPAWGVRCRSFTAGTSDADLSEMGEDGRLGMVYVETPANPTNDLFDIEVAARVAHDNDAVCVVDNTFLSPVWQRPARHGADLVVHSATKYLGGHSDLTAGVICGGGEMLEDLRHSRYRMGSSAPPSTAWLLTRSLETLRIRVERQTDTAIRVAGFLAEHPKVVSVGHLSCLDSDDPGYGIYKRQCLGPGAMVSFEVTGGEPGAFRFLNAMRVVNLATSLGGSESLASHPWSTSHSTMSPEEKASIGITPGLIRLSVGLESPDDLIADLGASLETV